MIRPHLLFNVALLLSCAEAFCAMPSVIPRTHVTTKQSWSRPATILSQYLDHPRPKVIETVLKILQAHSITSTICNPHPMFESRQLAIVIRETVENWKDKVGDMPYAYAVDSSCTHLLLMHKETEPIGYAAYKFTKPKTADITFFSIAARLEKQGFGKIFLDHIKEQLFRAGCRSVTVESVPNAKGFYDKAGFEKTSGTSSTHIAQNPYVISKKKRKRNC